MTTVYVLVPPGKENNAKITKEDINIADINVNVKLIHTQADLKTQLDDLIAIPFESGDVFCLAGLCPRRTTYDFAQLAKSRQENYMPGIGVDHRGVPIEPFKIQHRLAIEKNNYTVWPYLAIIGDPESAILSFKLLSLLRVEDFWPNYIPEVASLTHMLAIAATAGNWYTPDWFKVVDMSIRDLEIAPIMYSSHAWHDWIAFYPANGNFKLENHSQLYPVWLADSEKPLEYWQHERT